MRATLPASLACLLCLLATLASAQTTRNVGSGQPYPTIQSGIDAATPGDTVLIAPGTYFENINFHGKAITVTSSGGPAVTILDGSQTAPAVTFTSGETRASILSNLTIQHGGTLGFQASAVGGIEILGGAPTIQANVFTQNNCWTIHLVAGAPLTAKTGLRRPTAWETAASAVALVSNSATLSSPAPEEPSSAPLSSMATP